MPRVVRNFFVKGMVDGVKTPIHTGPKTAGGGFDLQFLIRDCGEVAQSVRVVGEHLEDGVLRIVVLDENGNEVHRHITKK